MPSGSTAWRSTRRRTRSPSDHSASGGPTPAKFGSAPPSDHGATASGSATPPSGRPGHAAHGGPARTASTRRYVPATTVGTAAGRASAPPIHRSSTVSGARDLRSRGREQGVDGLGGQLAQRHAGVVERGRCGRARGGGRRCP